MRIGGIEAGGTKMVCAIGEVQTDKGQPGESQVTITERVTIPTEKPKITLPRMAAFFEGKGISSLGIGCFGPVDLHRASPTYGYITSTPKLEWQNVDMVGIFSRALGVPVGFDTDVNAAVLGEVTWGAAKDCDTAIYITVGTGVGVGVYCNGALMHGLVHPEAGHLLLQRHPKDTYAGKCPYHANCLEGLASGPAVEARWGRPAKELADREDVWEMEAFYLAEAVANYVLTYSPQKIVLWGGIMHQSQLFSMVRAKVQELLGGYISNEKILKEIDTYLGAAGTWRKSGYYGSVCARYAGGRVPEAEGSVGAPENRIAESAGVKTEFRRTENGSAMPEIFLAQRSRVIL